MWNQVNTVLQDSENILSGLQAYKGAGQEIRDVGKICAHNGLSHRFGPHPRGFLTLRFLLLPFQAIQNPNDFMHQERAWNSVCPLVIKLKKFYSFSLRLGTVSGLENMS